MNKESGNIIIYIIAAIFLIGLLTLLVRGSSTPGGGIDREALILKASEVRSYAAELERGVQFVLQNGASETQISLAHPNHSSTYGTYGTTPEFEVFHPNGGGAEWRDNDSSIQTFDLDWTFTSGNAVDGVGTTCAANACADLIAILYDLTEDFCNVINDQIGAFDIPPPQTQTLFASNLFNGTYTYSYTIGDAGDVIEGHTEGCYQNSGGSSYGYYKVLLAR